MIFKLRNRPIWNTPQHLKSTKLSRNIKTLHVRTDDSSDDEAPQAVYQKETHTDEPGVEAESDSDSSKSNSNGPDEGNAELTEKQPKSKRSGRIIKPVNRFQDEQVF